MMIHDVENDCRIDITAARTHEHTCQRRKTHGRINTHTALDGCQGQTVAQMAINNAQVFFGTPMTLAIRSAT